MRQISRAGEIHQFTAKQYDAAPLKTRRGVYRPWKEQLLKGFVKGGSGMSLQSIGYDCKLSEGDAGYWKGFQ